METDSKKRVFVSSQGMIVMCKSEIAFQPTRRQILAAIVSAVLAPVIYIVAGQYIWQANLPMSLAISVMGALLLYRHRANITRLLQGTEPRVGSKKDAK